MGEVWMLLQAGSRFYLKVRGQTEIQKNALISLRWLSKDLAEGAPLSFRHYDPDNPSITTSHNGLVFGSPKDLDEKVSYNLQGRLLWNSVIAYYIDPDTQQLFRAKQLLDEPVNQAPQIQDDIHHVDILAGAESRRVIAREAVDINTKQGIQSIEVKLKFRDRKLGFGLTVQTRLEMKNK